MCKAWIVRGLCMTLPYPIVRDLLLNLCPPKVSNFAIPVVRAARLILVVVIVNIVVIVRTVHTSNMRWTGEKGNTHFASCNGAAHTFWCKRSSIKFKSIHAWSMHMCTSEQLRVHHYFHGSTK